MVQKIKYEMEEKMKEGKKDTLELKEVVTRWRSSITSTTILSQPSDMVSTMLSVTLSPREK